MLNRWLSDNEKKITALRHWLHAHPEVGFNEIETAAHLKDLLISVGYKITQTPEMKTGFTCEYGSGDGPVLGIRCDMDALLIQEISQADYTSKNDGVMHACGHDAHMTIVTSLALYIMESKPEISGRIRFIFQPAEEQAPGGAIAMIECGAIEGVDHIIGGHVLPKLTSDKIGLKHGPMAATVEMIEIELAGPGGHTSRPAESVDLIWAMSHLILSLEESIRHHLDQQDPVVLAFGKVKGGHTFNVLPDKIILNGTLRYLNTELKDRLHDIFDETVKGVERMTDAKISWSIPYTSPGVFNDKSVTDILIQAAEQSIGIENIEFMKASSMGGEDFAYYLEHIPGSYYRIGCYDGNSTDVHTPTFDVDDACVPTAIKVLEKAVEIYFTKESE
ncbi:MAG: amidohydrolase [Candidatus Marinimicrobia bacterium]|nr:amidohydrolase [Candidatus Neomarinimicrobiota bacterium]